MAQIAVVGSTGMLGRAVAAIRFPNHEVIEINRQGLAQVRDNQCFRTDSTLSNLEDIFRLNSIDYVINCAGLIRQKIFENELASVREAININAKLPLELVRMSEKFNFKILQIGTDCVFSGARGKYLEKDSHDALDLYGRSKSLGEVPHSNLLIIRSSIIGLENLSNKSLLSWFLSQERQATVKGFNDQFWNGVTVHHFAKILAGIVNNDVFGIFPNVQHLIPENFVSKGDLLNLFARHFDREDIQIDLTSSGNPLDMRLATESVDLNEKLWKYAGYLRPLTIEEMILEYSLSSNVGG